MSLPREVIPGRFYMITRRCTQRHLLMRPDDETNNAFAYCLAEAAERCMIDVILPSAMSNHHHTVVYDRFGNLPLFTEHLHKFFAKSQNVLLGRVENFWSNDQVSVVHLVDRAAVIDKIVYAATNPVKAGLVDRVHHWPGVNGLSALLNDRPIIARRPRHFFRQKGSMPEQVSLTLVIPPELGDRTEVVREIRERVAEAEEEIATERLKTGRRVLGRRAVLRQDRYTRPTTVEPRRNLHPRIATRSMSARNEAMRARREFQTAYCDSRTRWLVGETVAFPFGTYWLRRFANVPIAKATH